MFREDFVFKKEMALTLIISLLSYSVSAKEVFYQVKKGDQLGIILQSLGVHGRFGEGSLWGTFGKHSRVEDVAGKSKLLNPDEIEVGDRIYISISSEKLLHCNFEVDEKGEISIIRRLKTQKEFLNFVENNNHCRQVSHTAVIETPAPTPEPIKENPPVVAEVKPVEEKRRKNYLKVFSSRYNFTNKFGTYNNKNSIGFSAGRVIQDDDSVYLQAGVEYENLRFETDSVHIPAIGLEFDYKPFSWLWISDSLYYKDDLYMDNGSIVKIDSIAHKIGPTWVPYNKNNRTFLVGLRKKFSIPLQSSSFYIEHKDGYEALFKFMFDNYTFGASYQVEDKRFKDEDPEHERIRVEAGFSF